MKRAKIKRSILKQILQLLGTPKGQMRSIITAFALGGSLGIAYEEMVGIGTWHSFHPRTDIFNVCFTPPSGCGSLIAREIANAKISIYMQAYGLTSGSIIHQLKNAALRGVEVKVILDGGNLSDNKQIYSELKNSGIDVWFDRIAGIAHNKVIIIDNEKLVTGSYNFTNAADTKNVENVVFIKDKSIAQKYLENWVSRKNHSVSELKI